jgi:signal transduction histidine kinase
MVPVTWRRNTAAAGRSKPLRRRVRASILGITSVAVLLFAVPLALAISSGYRAQAIADLQRDATRVAAVVPDQFGTEGGTISLPTDLSRSLTVGVYRVDGTLVTYAGPRQSTVAAAAADGHLHEALEGSDLAVSAPVPSDAAVALTVRVSSPYALLQERTLRAWAMMALLAAFIGAVAAALASWQARQVARPLERLTANAQRLGDGDFTVRSTHSGITEADAADLALQTTAGRLGDLLERERAFTSDASHQLRTPLTALLLGLESALARPDADLRETTERALRRGVQLQRTIDDLLSLARHRQNNDAVLNVAELLDDIRDRWHGTFAARGRRLTLSVESDLPPAAASGAAVRQILDVLLDNALVHGAGRTRVDILDVGTGIAIMVADDGSGITGDPEAIFQRSWTTQHGQRDPDPAGHGIGLALARSLAQADGARLVLTRAAPRPMFSLLLRSGNPAPAPY